MIWLLEAMEKLKKDKARLKLLVCRAWNSRPRRALVLRRDKKLESLLQTKV